MPRTPKEIDWKIRHLLRTTDKSNSEIVREFRDHGVGIGAVRARAVEERTAGGRLAAERAAKSRVAKRQNPVAEEEILRLLKDHVVVGGEKKFRYSMEDVARITNLSKSAVHNYAKKLRSFRTPMHNKEVANRQRARSQRKSGLLETKADWEHARLVLARNKIFSSAVRKRLEKRIAREHEKALKRSASRPRKIPKPVFAEEKHRVIELMEKGKVPKELLNNNTVVERFWRISDLYRQGLRFEELAVKNPKSVAARKRKEIRQIISGLETVLFLDERLRPFSKTDEYQQIIRLYMPEKHQTTHKTKQTST